MDYTVRHAAWDDLSRIEEIYAYARQFMFLIKRPLFSG